MKTSEVIEVLVEGTGFTKEKAVSVALGSIQKKLTQADGSLIIRIEPLDVEVKEAIYEEWIEKFLFFFSPKQRTKYKVSLLVKVQVTQLHVKSISFKKKESK